jgi:hypothetical protein
LNGVKRAKEQLVAYKMHVDVGNQQSAVLIAAGYGIDCQGAQFESQYREDFFLSVSSRPVLRPTMPPIQ